MGQSSKKCKENIYKLFSQNLQWVAEHPAVKITEGFTHGYLCPLCLRLYYEEQLQPSDYGQLTLEDIPPASLGGRPKALTCKECNSRCGHELEGHLVKRLNEMDSEAFLPNSKTNVTFELFGNKMNGEIELDEKGAMKMHLHDHRSNPKETKQFMKDLIPPRTIYNPLFYPDKIFGEEERITPTFQMTFQKTAKERRAEIALLKIAYLEAFSTLGYGFLLNNNLEKVREQILNPDKEILPTYFGLNMQFSKENEGVNIIALPKEMQCFLVIFNLRTKSHTRQFNVVLPGPSDPGLKVYDSVRDGLNIGDGSGFANGFLEHFGPRDYLRNKEYALAAMQNWHGFTKDDYKPRLRPETETNITTIES